MADPDRSQPFHNFTAIGYLCADSAGIHRLLIFQLMLKRLLKKLDRQKYPFVDGIYYLVMIILLIIGILIIK